MNEFNVLLGAATNGTPSGSLFDALFARYIAPQESWRELESPLPITILAAGKDLIDYRIYGNTENGESAGVETENLYNGAIGIDNMRYNDPRGTTVYDDRYEFSELIPVLPNTDYTLSWDHVKETSRTSFMVGYYDLSGIKCIGASSLGTYTTELHFSLTVNTPKNCRFVRLQRKKQFDFNMMFNLGSTAPTSYIPYGYKLPMVVRSENLIDKDLTKNEDRKKLTSYGNIESNPYHCISDYIPILPGTVYSVFNPNSGNNVYHCFYDSNKNFLMSFPATGQNLQTATSPANAAYIRCSLLSYSMYPDAFASAMLFEGSTAPTEYIPYYRDEENIYIGSDPLAEDEYVDFGEQKVYRMVDGTLTPTDPPVPLPALPTTEGETIIDYNPSETPAVEPEKMYVKYKPQEMI